MTPPARGLFALDLRALAVMRIGMGLLLAVDLALRAVDFDAHYGDHGVLPREAFLDRFLRFGRICLHAYVPDTGQVVLWVVAAIAAVMLTVGYRTRLATIVCWVLLASLHSRNYMVIQAGDTALRMMLLWSVFLPLGARWSVDAWLRGDRPPAVAIRTVATAALIAQLALIYGTATLSKLSHPVWWHDGLGVYYALSTEQFTTGLGLWLRDVTWLAVALNYATLVIQGLAPLLLLLPWANERARTVAAAVLIPMHIAFMLCLSIGLFSYIVIVFWLAMLPPPLWDRVESWVDRARARLPRVGGPWLEGARRRRRDRPHPVLRVGTGKLARGFVGVAAAYGLWWNLSDNPAIPMTEAERLPGRVLRMEQRWHMFSNPPRTSGWYVVVGSVAGGRTIDPRTGEPPAFDPPRRVSATFPGQRWRKYMTNAETKRYRRHRTMLLDYWCRRWNRQYPDRRMHRAALIKMERRSAPPDQPRARVMRRRLAHHQCPT